MAGHMLVNKTNQPNGVLTVKIPQNLLQSPLSNIYYKQPDLFFFCCYLYLAMLFFINFFIKYIFLKIKDIL